MGCGASAPRLMLAPLEASVYEPPEFSCERPMLVMRYEAFKSTGRLVRSDAAAGLLEVPPGGCTCIFVSHRWWSPSAPDITEGEDASLKFRVVCQGVDWLIAKHRLAEGSVCLWMDWFSIDQVNPELKLQGIRSLLHYVSRCQFMLIPLVDPARPSCLSSQGAPPRFPEQVPGYGARAWCRLESFAFSLRAEMLSRGEGGGVGLYLSDAAGTVSQFERVHPRWGSVAIADVEARGRAG